MKKTAARVLVPALCLAVAAAALAGCVKKFYLNADEKMSVENFFEYGPVEAHGAEVDHVINQVPYAPDVPYSEYLTLDIYYNERQGEQPVIVNIHGGAWLLGDKDDSNSIYRCQYLANHGYVVFSVNYRLLPDVPIQTQVEDVMGAVIWVKKNAARYGGDPSRIGVMGGSAGGHLATMVAWASDDPFFKPTGHYDSDVDSDVLAAVPYYAVLDLEQTLSLGKDKLAETSYKIFLKEKDEFNQRQIMRHVSPKYHVREGLPPTFLICGDEDNFGLYPDQVRFKTLLEEKGVDTGLYTAKGAAHGFDRRYGEKYTAEALEATLAWFDKYVK